MKRDTKGRFAKRTSKEFEKEFERKLKEKDEELKAKDGQIKELMRARRVFLNDFYGDVYKFGVVSDTHIGSIHEKTAELGAAYRYFHKEGIKDVFHCGDVAEGEGVYRGQEYERYMTGADTLVKHIVETYPAINGMKTYFITGSHDLSYYKTAGYDIGIRISEHRPDMIYLGQDTADLKITKNFTIRLVHPGGGTSYALSYQVQKYIESLSGGQKPTIILFGHYHKAEYLPCYRNIFAFQSGCFQGQTTFMRRKRLPSHLGFWTIEAMVNKKRLVSRVKAEFVAFYEKTIIHSLNEPTTF